MISPIPSISRTAPILDEAFSDIAADYKENLPANARIALINFELEMRLLSGYMMLRVLRVS
ncbi:MAG: hypothetical protein LBL45_08305 [Treponema sp.]|jgi:hypothetical protein|nr:hypothetical protein [Treponema sp.]